MGEKLFYKIGEVSQITGLEPYVLRYWESEFPLLKPRKNKGGQRAYLQKDIDLVLKIKQMLYQEGYTIHGAKMKLRTPDRAASGRDISHLIHKVKTELRGILEGIKQS